MIKNFLSEKGLDYEVDADNDFVYTDEIKQMLDKREADYLNGKDVPITAEESRKQIDAILNRQR